MTRGVISVSSLLHAWRVPRPKGPRLGAIHVMRGMRGVWHVALDLLFSSSTGGTYWPIAIRCPSLPFEGPPSCRGGGGYYVGRK